jgi:hypothetical protein
LNFDDNGQMTVASLTPAADIYSLAKSVYTLVTGEAPRAFANKQIEELPLTWRDKEWSEDLLRVVKRATSPDPNARHQTIDEFWQELEPVRKIAYDMETATSVRPKMHETPQPHVARGYSPLAPQQPRFDSSKLRQPFGPVSKAASAPDALQPTNHPVRRSGGHPSFSKEGSFRDATHREDAERAETRPSMPLVRDAVATYQPPQRVENYYQQHQNGPTPIVIDEVEQPIRKKRSFARRLATFAILLAIFAGGLYGTSAFLRSRGILPPISNPFTTKTGRANTDINLRPEPNANNDPIGLVTKDSRVRIIKTQNNWYQVEIVEQGRQRDVPLPTNRGWLNGRYVDLD